MRLTLPMFRSLHKAIDYYGRYHPSVLSIQQFIDFGTKDISAKNSFLFLKKEIPVRLANIMKEIQLLPEQLLEMPSVKVVQGWYEKSFDEILEFEEAAPTDKVLSKFLDSLDTIRNRHLSVVETMAEGVINMKDKLNVIEQMKTVSNLNERIHYFLDRFYLSRISIRLIIHQHLLLFGQKDKNTSLIGCFDPSCDVLAVAEDAYENARFVCEQYYSTAPTCKFISQKPYENDSSAISMTYVPVHLYYMLFELFKNSLRAVVEFHQNGSEDLPPLELLVCKGKEDVSIKLADQGGGVPRMDIDKLFNYLYSTATPPSRDSDPSINAPLAGYGYGLPIARLYAKYFNGDLVLNSVDGYGTDAIIYLKVIPREASELLPIYNKTSSQKYSNHIQVKDWSEPHKY